MKMSHIDGSGNIKMVDISDKDTTQRMAVAKGAVIFSGEAYESVKKSEISKGDVLTTAKIAGIQAAKNTASLIPLCHQIPLSSIEIEFEFDDENYRINIKSRINCSAKTGAEMEALTAVAVASLTIYDMCKAIDKGIIITDIKLLEKSGGKSGHYRKDG